MGVTLSKCVNLAGQAVYLEETYTVVRTSGEQQDGWLLTTKRHTCVNTAGSVHPDALALLKQEGWAIHLHNGDQSEEAPENHACGWRRLGTFWPTRLTGNQAAIDSWTNCFRAKLEQLAGEQGLPDHWEQHSCSRGAPAHYCGGCCGERRAKEKKALLEELKSIRATKDGICETEDLSLPATKERLAALEHEERVAEYKLAKIPTAAQSRAWRAWRDVADQLEAAERDYRIACSSKSWEGHEDLKAEVEKLKARAEELRPAAFPPEPVDPDADPPPSELDERLAELGAVPYHPVYAPLSPDSH